MPAETVQGNTSVQVPQPSPSEVDHSVRRWMGHGAGIVRTSSRAGGWDSAHASCFRLGFRRWRRLPGREPTRALQRKIGFHSRERPPLRASGRPLSTGRTLGRAFGRSSGRRPLAAGSGVAGKSDRALALRARHPSGDVDVRAFDQPQAASRRISQHRWLEGRSGRALARASIPAASGHERSSSLWAPDNPHSGVGIVASDASAGRSLVHVR